MVIGRDWTAAGGNETAGAGAGLGLGATAAGGADGNEGATRAGWGKACGTGREGAAPAGGSGRAAVGAGTWAGPGRKASCRDGVGTAGTWAAGGVPAAAGRDDTPVPGTTTVRAGGAAKASGVGLGVPASRVDGTDAVGSAVTGVGSGLEAGG